MGFNDLRKQKVDTSGGTSVHITGPLTTFGELSIAELTPVGQGDFVYNINSQIFTTSTFASCIAPPRPISVNKSFVKALAEDPPFNKEGQNP